MACDIQELIQSPPQVWQNFNPEMITAMQVILMCDALNGQNVTDINLNELQQRVCCFQAFGLNKLLGMWTVLFAQILNVAATGASQIVYYTGDDPNTDGVVPPNQLGPALAIKPYSTTYTWDNVNFLWT